VGLCLAARDDRPKLLDDFQRHALVQVLLDRRGSRLLIPLALLDPLCPPGLHHSKRSTYALNCRSLCVVLSRFALL